MAESAKTDIINSDFSFAVIDVLINGKFRLNGLESSHIVSLNCWLGLRRDLSFPRWRASMPIPECVLLYYSIAVTC